MSVDTFVFLNQDALPTVSEWNAALRSAGVALQLDDVDDLVTFSGYLPARLDGRDTGFEWLFGTIEEVFGEARPGTGNRAHAADFTTHSDMIELAAAQYAAAVLAKAADGILYDGESGETFSPDELIQIATETVKQA